MTQELQSHSPGSNLLHLDRCIFVCMKGQNSSWPCASEIQLPFYWVNKTINVVNGPRIIHSFLNPLTAFGLMTLFGNKLTLQIINCYWDILVQDFKAANNTSQVWKHHKERDSAPWFLFIFLFLVMLQGILSYVQGFPLGYLVLWGWARNWSAWLTPSLGADHTMHYPEVILNSKQVLRAKAN